MIDFKVLSYSSIQEFFSSLGVPTDEVGFFDHPNFIRNESIIPLLLARYANFVDKRPRSALYNKYVEKTVPVICEVLHRELVAEGRLGACVDMSMVLQRILDAENIWSYCVSGSLHIQFPHHPHLEDVFFYGVDISNIDGHAWVVAPPYGIIDITIKQQAFFQAGARGFIPEFILERAGKKCEWFEQEVCSPERRMLAKARGESLLSAIRQVTGAQDINSAFPPKRIQSENAYFKYIPLGVRISDVSLEKITNQKWNGRFGGAVYEDLIKPKLAEIRGEPA